MSFDTINPTTEKIITSYEFDKSQKVQKTLELAEKSQKKWQNLSDRKKERLFKELAKLLESNKDSLARSMTTEMGKPLRQARLEIEKCAWLCNFYSEQAPLFLQDQIIQTSYQKSYVSYQPLGCILGIMPWNYPLWQIFRFAIPTLLAGNTVIIKPALNVPECSLKVLSLFKEAGFPEGVYQNLFLTNEKTNKLIANPIIKGVSLTGSTKAGSAVAKRAGQYLKKTVLELGGSDPYLILHDADLELAARVCVASRFNNCGQTCVAAKRWIVVKSVAQDFTDLVLKLISQKNLGDPFDEATDIGPMARLDLLQNLQEQVKAIKAEGASLLCGGKKLKKKGFFFEPTLFTDVTKNSLAQNSEVFGPVASIMTVSHESEAIALANDTSFGLGSAVFSQDLERAENIARNQLKFGSAFVNGMVKSDPRLPFGGIGQSGMGRELAQFGILEFTNIKTIAVV